MRLTEEEARRLGIIMPDAAPKRVSKYHANITIVEDVQFDSAKEAQRYTVLRLLERAGLIEGLQLQKKFVLIPSQRDASGRCIERECAYYADFVYRDKRTWRVVVEDVKGFRTDAYIIKKKLMLFVHGISIKEV